MRSSSAGRAFVPALQIAFAAACFAAVSHVLILNHPWRRQHIVLGAVLCLALAVLAICRLRRGHFVSWIPWIVTLAPLALSIAAVVHYRAANEDRNLPPLALSFDGAALARDDWATRLSSAEAGGALARMTISFSQLNPRGERTLAQEILRDEFTFLDHPKIRLETPLHWDEIAYDDPSWNWALQTQSYVHTLLKAYRESGDITFLRKAEELVFAWLGANTVYATLPPSRFTWDDHAISLRVVAWLRFWHTWLHSPAFSEHKAKLLLRAILGHAGYLMDAKLYLRQHNHGIDADIALLAISYSFPEAKGAPAWRELARARLQEQLASTISPRGVHLEHSPSYHLSTLEHLDELRRFLRAVDPALCARLELDRIVPAMAKFVPLMMRPDGSLVPFGDSSVDDRVSVATPGLRDLAGADPQLARDLSGQVRSDVTILEEEGYAIIRAEFGERPEHRLHLAFTSASHPGRIHKHFDDLSFVLFACGREILADMGRYSYRNDEFRRYALSTRSHNTVEIGDEFSSTGPWQNGYGDTTISLVHASDAAVVLLGSTTRHPGYAHQRRLTWFAHKFLVIVDEIVPTDASIARGDEPLRQRFHLGRALSAEMRDGAAVASQDADELIAILQTGEGTAQRIVRGQRDPLLGWSSTGHGQVVPIDTVEAAATHVGRFETILALNDRCRGKIGPIDTQEVLQQVRMLEAEGLTR